MPSFAGDVMQLSVVERSPLNLLPRQFVARGYLDRVLVLVLVLGSGCSAEYASTSKTHFTGQTAAWFMFCISAMARPGWAGHFVNWGSRALISLATYGALNGSIRSMGY